MVRLDDGGAVLTLAGYYWSVVRLTAAGTVQWEVPLPVPDPVKYGPSAAVTGDGSFVVIYPTAYGPENEPNCRAIRLDENGAELAAYDYGYGCFSLVGAPDGGFVIGTGHRQAGQPIEPHDTVSVGPDGTIRWAVATGGCRFVAVAAADGDQVFAGMHVRDCDADGQPIVDTNRPWLGRLDSGSGELAWEHEGDIAAEHTFQIVPLGSGVIALEWNQQAAFDPEDISRLRSIDRADGTERWLVESAGRTFRNIGGMGGTRVVAGGFEDGVPMLWMYDENADEVGAWIVDRYFGPPEAAPLAAAEDRSVLAFSATEEWTDPAVVRYDLPL